ncbi:hypothetical protein P799_26700 [Lysinibacillus sphaericus CBAM5]|uniref:Uncharacterized protein n=2 Tax=Lysinibacillus sphaericus TaxID=1421 RepID=B1HZ71_LYSSC|nr:hypothetical protein Bsph_0855 [Lysinibacillus sphaericus C3-41]EWH30298.1 hypothetical protein P799_26700 [Lysinibacillus sphaericus CBAM5]
MIIHKGIPPKVNLMIFYTIIKHFGFNEKLNNLEKKGIK